jgi:hypothetical protein
MLSAIRNLLSIFGFRLGPQNPGPQATPFQGRRFFFPTDGTVSKFTYPYRHVNPNLYTTSLQAYHPNSSRSGESSKADSSLRSEFVTFSIRKHFVHIPQVKGLSS